MNKKIVIINGSGGTGKDEFCKICRYNVNTMIVSSVDKVKKAAELLGWDKNNKTEHDRKFLSDLGYLSEQFNNGKYEYIKEKIEEFQDTVNVVLFIHIREIDFIEKIKQEFKARTLLILNDNVKKINSNTADANVENYIYDYVIDNSGTLEDLEEEADKFIDEVVLTSWDTDVPEVIGTIEAIKAILRMGTIIQNVKTSFKYILCFNEKRQKYYEINNINIIDSVMDHELDSNQWIIYKGNKS